MEEQILINYTPNKQGYTLSVSGGAEFFGDEKNPKSAELVAILEKFVAKIKQ